MVSLCLLSSSFLFSNVQHIHMSTTHLKQTHSTHRCLRASLCCFSLSSAFFCASILRVATSEAWNVASSSLHTANKQIKQCVSACHMCFLLCVVLLFSVWPHQRPGKWRLPPCTQQKSVQVACASACHMCRLLSSVLRFCVPHLKLTFKHTPQQTQTQTRTHT